MVICHHHIDPELRGELYLFDAFYPAVHCDDQLRSVLGDLPHGSFGKTVSFLQPVRYSKIHCGIRLLSQERIQYRSRCNSVCVIVAEYRDRLPVVDSFRYSLDSFVHSLHFVRIGELFSSPGEEPLGVLRRFQSARNAYPRCEKRQRISFGDKFCHILGRVVFIVFVYPSLVVHLLFKGPS